MSTTIEEGVEPKSELMAPDTERRQELMAQDPGSVSASVLAVIERAARDSEVDVDKMERLLQMQERIFAKQAEAEFFQALADFQEECPQIQRTKHIPGRAEGSVIGRYAPYDSMMKTVRPLMIKYGFSETFDSQRDQGLVKVICTLSHRGGHQVQSSFEAPIDKSGAKNDIQAVGSSISYGKRYSLGQCLGLVFTDEDDDGSAALKPDTSQIQGVYGDEGEKETGRQDARPHVEGRRPKDAATQSPEAREAVIAAVREKMGTVSPPIEEAIMDEIVLNRCGAKLEGETWWDVTVSMKTLEWLLTEKGWNRVLTEYEKMG